MQVSQIQGRCEAIGCFATKDPTAGAELINRKVMTKSTLGQCLEQTSEFGMDLYERSQTGGNIFRDVITSTSGNAPSWDAVGKIKGIVNVQVFHGRRILYLEGDSDQCTPDAVLVDKTRGELYRTHARRAGLPFLTVGVYHYECNATKSYSAVIGNIRFINRA